MTSPGETSATLGFVDDNTTVLPLSVSPREFRAYARTCEMCVGASVAESIDTTTVTVVDGELAPDVPNGLAEVAVGSEPSEAHPNVNAAAAARRTGSERATLWNESIFPQADEVWRLDWRGSIP